MIRDTLCDATVSIFCVEIDVILRFKIVEAMLARNYDSMRTSTFDEPKVQNSIHIPTFPALLPLKFSPTDVVTILRSTHSTLIALVNLLVINRIHRRSNDYRRLKHMFQELETVFKRWRTSILSSAASAMSKCQKFDGFDIT